MTNIIFLKLKVNYFCKIKTMKNSCNGRRGCSVRIILPNDGRVIIIHNEVYGKRNDIQKILPFTNILLDKVA